MNHCVFTLRHFFNDPEGNFLHLIQQPESLP